MDGVDQHRPRSRIDGTLRDEIIDPVQGFLADPRIDGEPLGVGLGPEVRQVDAAAEVRGQGVEIRLLERERAVAPTCIYNMQAEVGRIRGRTGAAAALVHVLRLVQSGVRPGRELLVEPVKRAEIDVA